jgi:hypothetical protein
MLTFGLFHITVMQFTNLVPTWNFTNNALALRNLFLSLVIGLELLEISGCLLFCGGHIEELAFYTLWLTWPSLSVELALSLNHSHTSTSLTTLARQLDPSLSPMSPIPSV